MVKAENRFAQLDSELCCIGKELEAVRTSNLAEEARAARGAETNLEATQSSGGADPFLPLRLLKKGCLKGLFCAF